jgi:hypothetical protein
MIVFKSKCLALAYGWFVFNPPVKRMAAGRTHRLELLAHQVRA